MKQNEDAFTGVQLATIVMAFVILAVIFAFAVTSPRGSVIDDTHNIQKTITITEKEFGQGNYGQSEYRIKDECGNWYQVFQPDREGEPLWRQLCINSTYTFDIAPGTQKNQPQSRSSPYITGYIRYLLPSCASVNQPACQPVACSGCY